MDLNIVLWFGGMFFTLMIFAIKVGVGLGLGGMKWKAVVMTLSLYLLLFVAIALLSGHLIYLFEPVLKRGPYLHTLVALGMIVWGLYIVRKCNSATVRQIKTPAEDLRVKEASEMGDQKSKNSMPNTYHSLLLLIPCPVCLTAMTFSTWAALSVIQLPTAVVGLGLGVVFIMLSLAVYYFLKLITLNASLITQETGLGLGMIAIGLYFLASLVIPAKIEEARGVYESFLASGIEFIEVTKLAGSLGILFVFVLLGYFVTDRLRITR